MLLVLTSVAAFAFASGLSYPLFGIMLTEAGNSITSVGVSAAATSIGIVVSTPLIPALERLLQKRRLALAASLTGSACFALNLGADGLVLIFLSRMLLGMCINALYIFSEAWLNEITDANTRGRTFGFYTTVLSIGFAAGPLSLSLLPQAEDGLFLGALGLLTAATLIMVFNATAVETVVERNAEARRAVNLNFLMSIILPIASSAAFGFFDQVTLSLIPVFVLETGLPVATAAVSVTALTLGGIAIQYPIGWLADRKSPATAFWLCTLCTICGSGILPSVVSLGEAYLYPFLLLWGGIAFGTKTLGLVYLSKILSHEEFLVGASMCSIAYGLSGIVAVPLTAWLMDHFGIQSLPLAVAATFSAVAVILVAKPREGQ